MNNNFRFFITILILLILFGISGVINAEEDNIPTNSKTETSKDNYNHSKSKKNIIVTYKKYERFDLGNLEIKGSVIAPGDLSVKNKRRKIFSRRLLSRDNFDDFSVHEIDTLK